MNLFFEFTNLLIYGISIACILYCIFNLAYKRKLSFPLLLIRLLIFITLILIIASPYVLDSETTKEIPLLVDISESMDQINASQILDKYKYIDPSITLSLIPFAGKTGIPVHFIEDYKSFKNSWSSLDIGKTNIYDAISSLSENGNNQALLLTDGHINTGKDMSKVIELAKNKKIKIYPIFDDQKIVPDYNFSLTALSMPMIAPSESPVEINATIKNNTESEESGILIFTQDNKIIEKKNVTIQPNFEKVISSKSLISKGGVYEINATFEPQNKKYNSSSISTYVSQEEREKILLLSGSSEEDKILNLLFQNQVFKLENFNVNSSSEILPNFNEYSVVIFNNIPYSNIGLRKSDELIKYVKNGGGFIMIGGNKSFGLGGYVDTPLADVLPVIPIIPRTVQKRLNSAVELVIDKSRSMAESQKLEYAKEASKEVIRNLKDEDLVGVIGFDSTPFLLVKLGLLSEIRESSLSRIDRLYSAGQTNLLPALDEARRSLERADAGRKHTIILTDGKLPDSGPIYSEIASQMRSKGITVSTVLLGGYTSDDTLKDIARSGGGSYYETPDASSLPAIFMKDIKVNTGEKTIKENTEFGVKRNPSKVYSSKVNAFPPLKGYVETKPKENTNLELVVESNGKIDPLYASWNYGEGKVGAFTSDASGRWSYNWINSDSFNFKLQGKFSEFWIETITSLRKLQGNESEAVKFDLNQYVENGSLHLKVNVYTEKFAKDLTGILTLPDKTKKDINFEKINRGSFKFVISDIIPGKFDLTLQSNHKTFTPVSFKVNGDLFGEKKGTGIDKQFLEKLAFESGGIVNPDKDELIKITSKIKESKIDISRHFFWILIILFMLEILIRERFNY